MVSTMSFVSIAVLLTDLAAPGTPSCVISIVAAIVNMTPSVAALFPMLV